MSELVVGGIFRHFKGNYYIIEALAKDANTQENMVVYRALYGNKMVWVRAVANFMGRVEEGRVDNITGQEFRFEEVSEV